MTAAITTDPSVEETTEILDLDVAKMSAVGLPANGTTFLVMKAQAEGKGLLTTDAVRDLIKESTVTETPDAPVAKADGAELDEGTLLAEAADGAPTLNPDIPGSAGWEAVDAATASKVANVLARTKAAIQLLADRERVEVATGAEEDADAAWCLEDANEALDFAISIVAPFALSEALEAEQANGDMETIMKATGDLSRPVEFLEALAPVMKAGRTLSAANEQAIRTAIASLTNVINTLPAPAPDPAAPAAVAKSTQETTVTDAPENEITSPELAAAIAKSVADAAEAPSEAVADEPAAEVTKAKGDPAVAVYDDEGTLIGTVKPDAITPLTSASKPGGADVPDGSAAPVDLTPAPAADAGTPADAVAAAPAAVVPVVKAAEPNTATDPVAPAVNDELAALVAKAVQDAREEDASALLAQAEVIKGLQDRVTELGQIAPPKVLSNGAAVPQLAPGRNLSAPTKGAIDAVVAERGAVLKSQLATATDAADQKRIGDELNELANAALDRIHGRHG